MTPLAVGRPHGQRGWLGGRRRNNVRIQTASAAAISIRLQPCNLPLAYVQARQWNDDRNFENVLAYSTAHELSRTPFPPKPWQLEQTRPGAIKASGSLSFLSKRIGSPHHAKPSVLCSLRS